MDTNKNIEKETFEIDSNLFKSGAMIYRAVNNGCRQKILWLLHQEQIMTVTELYVRMELEQSVASQHLSILREAGLVKTERRGKFIFYSVNYSRLSELRQITKKLMLGNYHQVQAPKRDVLLEACM